MKTVAITAFHSFISKNILNVGVLAEILKEPGVRVVIFVPKIKEEFFANAYNDDRVKVIGVDMVPILAQLSVKRFSRLAYLLMNSHYLWYKKVERRMANKNKVLAWLKYWGEVLFTKLFANRKLTTVILRKQYHKRVVVPEIGELLRKESPDVLFSTDIFDEDDVIFMSEARRLGIKVVGMVRSWDNCYSKGIARILPDIALVNNETLKDELVTMHLMHVNKIKMVGLPQFDYSLRREKMPRAEFLQSIGAPEDTKLIVFSPAGAILSDTDWQLCQIIAEAINEGEIKYPVHVLVRNHPNHPADLSRAKLGEHFTIENPGTAFGSKNPKDSELSLKESDHLSNTVYHADLVMYVATTLGIDALVFNKPQIIINFDGYEKKPYTLSVKRFHNEDHMKKMINCGGVKLVKNKEELVHQINAYLENPTLDQEGRDKMFAQQLWKLDGNSPKRIAEAIFSL